MVKARANQSNISSNMLIIASWVKCWFGLNTFKICEKKMLDDDKLCWMKVYVRKTFIQRIFTLFNIIFMLDSFKRGFHPTLRHLWPDERGYLYLLKQIQSPLHSSSVISSRIVMLKYPLTLLLSIYNLVLPGFGHLNPLVQPQFSIDGCK